MNELITKQFESTNIEIIEINGEIYFEVYSVGMALGHVKIAKGNEYPRKERIDENIKSAEVTPVVHNGQRYISESQLYDFMFEVHTEKVKPFKKWVTSEVLPTLRRTGSYEMPKQPKEELKKKDADRLPLPSVNAMVKNVTKFLEKAGVDDLYIAAEMKRIYTDAGYPVNAPLITDETMPKLYDCTEIAKELGIVSKTGNPHNKAVSAIIQQLDIKDDEIVTTAFSRNGHDDVTVQYKPTVFDKVKNWLTENSYPTVISGHGKNYTVTYSVVEVA